MNTPLPALFGSQSAAQVLLFLQNYGDGHARRIATTFDVPHMAIQRQLRRLEDAGILVSRKLGNTRVFGWNPRSTTVRNLRTFLEAELGRLPRETTEAYFRQRQRPQRTAKPLQSMAITASTTAIELAALVSQALEAAGINATLSGGGAVSVYTDNQYQSSDLDFVTAARRDSLRVALRPLGFNLAKDRRHFTHPDTALFLEFQTGPLEFGDRVVHHDDVPRFQTPWGPLRVITPTQCVMDRLAAFWHWRDRQSWDQAVLVAAHQTIDYDELAANAASEGADPGDIARLHEQACRHA